MAAGLGARVAILDKDDPSLLPGVNTYEGRLTIGPVGEALGIPATDLRTLLPA